MVRTSLAVTVSVDLADEEAGLVKQGSRGGRGPITRRVATAIAQLGEGLPQFLFISMARQTDRYTNTNTSL